jgi:cysteine desulfurase
MSQTCIYLDYAATTPVDENVISIMTQYMGFSGKFGNPASSSHEFGQSAKLAVEYARTQVAQLIGAQPAQIVWTSGATESNNLAIKGVLEHFFKKHPGKSAHIVSSPLEHKAVLDTLHYAETLGATVTWVHPDSTGAITLEAVCAALREDTLLVTLMLVNNEIGSITDVAAIAAAVRAHGALMHVDAAQATGKVEIDLGAWAVDMLSLSAHKTYGPKGIGALYVGERAAPLMQAQIHGGGHEHGLRSGTLATHQIVGMGSAFAIAGQKLTSETSRMQNLRGAFLHELEGIPGITLNAAQTQTVPNTLSLTIANSSFDPAYLNGRMALSTTSACNSASNKPSHVLTGIGLSPEQAARTLRISFGRYSSEEDAVEAAKALRETLDALRAM